MNTDAALRRHSVPADGAMFWDNSVRPVLLELAEDLAGVKLLDLVG